MICKRCGTACFLMNTPPDTAHEENKHHFFYFECPECEVHYAVLKEDDVVTVHYIEGDLSMTRAWELWYNSTDFAEHARNDIKKSWMEGKLGLIVNRHAYEG